MTTRCVHSRTCPEQCQHGWPCDCPKSVPVAVLPLGQLMAEVFDELAKETSEAKDVVARPQPREHAVQCLWCPPGRTTWNLSGVCDRHEDLDPNGQLTALHEKLPRLAALYAELPDA